MPSFAFDIVLSAAVHVEAATEQDAKRILAAKFDCADCNGGTWDNGDPILFEASLISEGDKRPLPGANGPELFDVDGDAIEVTPSDALLAALKALVPYAHSRAEDMHDAGGDHDPNWVAANLAVDAANEAIAAYEASRLTERRLMITLDGGLVQAVVSKSPELIGIEVDVVDYDVEGSDADRRTPIRQPDGTLVDACVGGETVCAQGVEIVDAPDDATRAPAD